ncbi:hypothetical protein [Neptuniibacter sp. 1_MG-2023]|uniref:hypothetical protein n=1 Tax=Neptuniibacter sp. 1_MG-2023 TaxID=3062662 RepID=UPI0026E3D76D|nr:hypothetical protein [Neptuniibacter sp. 1_MG-2023]MDO6593506.1 hypothetical protein [Neptuniibacter sp. 1_MG-2023]
MFFWSILLIAQLKCPNIIDLEASGFGVDSYPIEVGFVLSDGTRYCSLIRPKDDWLHWSDEAEEHHKIPRTDLIQSGASVEQVASELNHKLYNQTVYSDGWVVDQTWLIKLFYRAGMPMQFRVSALDMILSEPQMDIWHQVKQEVETELNIVRHRASNDALIIQQTFVRTREISQALQHT